MRTKYSSATISASGLFPARGNRPLPRDVVLGDQSSAADGWASGILARGAGSAQTSKSPGKWTSNAGDDVRAETCRNLPKPPRSRWATTGPHEKPASEIALIRSSSSSRPRRGSHMPPLQSSSKRESGALIRAGVASTHALPGGQATANRNHLRVAFRSVCNATKSIDIPGTYTLLRGCGKLDTI
jgi:hypothetical protein